MKNAITYTISLKEYMQRAILVAVLFAIAPFYDDHTERFISVSLMIFGFILLSWISSRFIVVKINEESLQGIVLSIPILPVVRNRVIAWEDIESITVKNWYGLKYYVVATKGSSTNSVGVPVHLKDKQAFKNQVESFSGKDSPLSRALRSDL